MNNGDKALALLVASCVWDRCCPQLFNPTQPAQGQQVMSQRRHIDVTMSNRRRNDVGFALVLAGITVFNTNL